MAVIPLLAMVRKDLQLFFSDRRSVIVSFVVLAHFTGAPPGSTYTPAHVEDGVLVPGTTQ